MHHPTINVVLYEPEIPANTGNIIRTCSGLNCNLHLIRPYGFFIKDKVIKRSATNHLNLNELVEYDDWNDFLNKTDASKENMYFFTKRGQKTPNQFVYNKPDEKNIYLVFGKESSGIPKEILKTYSNHNVRLPMSKDTISLNLSNVVAIAVYEVLRQWDFNGLEINEDGKLWED